MGSEASPESSPNMESQLEAPGALTLGQQDGTSQGRPSLDPQTQRESRAASGWRKPFSLESFSSSPLTQLVLGNLYSSSGT